MPPVPRQGKIHADDDWLRLQRSPTQILHIRHLPHVHRNQITFKAMKPYLRNLLMHICAVAAVSIAWSVDASAQGYADYITQAEKGDAVSQYAVGLCYQNGKGINIDYSKAAEWFEKSASQNLPAAQYRLGLLYYNGQGVTSDLDTAESWFRKAAMQDHLESQYYLGLCRFEKRAFEESLIWLTKVARQDIPEAQYLAGLQYEEALGTEQNIPEAKKWYRLAAEHGLGQAQNHLAKLLAVEENYTEALKWWEEAGKQGVYEASFMAAVCYEKGYGTDINILQAMVWYLKADEQGHPGAKTKYDELLVTLSDVL